MRAKIALLIAVVLVFASVIVLPRFASAQGAKVDGKPGDVIAKAAALKSTGDDQKDMALLSDLTAQISAQNIACNGLTFKGRGSKVYDPFDLAEGVYRITGKGQTNIFANFQSLGKIGDHFCTGAWIGTEALMQFSDGCRLLLSV